MPNKVSRAGHIPERTCVICRKKQGKSELLRFVLLEDEVVIDLEKKIQARGYYVCDDNVCLLRIDKWLKKKIRKKNK